MKCSSIRCAMACGSTQETEFDVSFLSRAFKVSAVCEAI